MSDDEGRHMPATLLVISKCDSWASRVPSMFWTYYGNVPPSPSIRSPKKQISYKNSMWNARHTFLVSRDGSHRPLCLAWSLCHLHQETNTPWARQQLLLTSPSPAQPASALCRRRSSECTPVSREPRLGLLSLLWPVISGQGTLDQQFSSLN